MWPAVARAHGSWCFEGRVVSGSKSRNSTSCSESWDMDRDRDCAQRHITLETLSMLTGSGPELLFLSVFVIESRNVDVSGRDWVQTHGG